MSVKIAYKLRYLHRNLQISVLYYARLKSYTMAFCSASLRVYDASLYMLYFKSR